MVSRSSCVQPCTGSVLTARPGRQRAPWFDAHLDAEHVRRAHLEDLVPLVVGVGRGAENLSHAARVVGVEVPRPRLAVVRSRQPDAGQDAVLSAVRVVHVPVPALRRGVPLAQDRRLRGHVLVKRRRRLRGQHRRVAVPGDGRRGHPGVAVRARRTDRQADPVLNGAGRAGVVDVVGVLLGDVEDGVEADGGGVPTASRRVGKSDSRRPGASGTDRSRPPRPCRSPPRPDSTTTRPSRT